MKQQRILVINGPNLNMLGKREPAIYGTATLKDIEKLCKDTAEQFDMTVDCRQSNIEGDIVTWIQESPSKYAGIVINAAAYSHTSVAILDALRLAGLPAVEVHITNIFARESFRQHSFVSQAVLGVISGLGISGYSYAIEYLAGHLDTKTRKKS